MKKIITNIQIIAMMSMLPAIGIAYLHNNEAAPKEEKSTLVSKPGINITESAKVFHLIKSF